MLNSKTVVTCAVTGGSSRVLAKHPGIPKTPQEIADAAIEAARAGAAIVHLHVREPHTGVPSSDLALYREVQERILASDVDVVINFTCGMDGEIIFESIDPVRAGPGTCLRDAEQRVAHAVALKPEIATLDCGTMAFGEAIFVARMSDLTTMAIAMRSAGVKPELECFEFGHIENAKRLIAIGALDTPALFQLCLGTGDGAPATPGVLRAMVDELPEGSTWAAFGCGATEMPMVAATVNLGGHVRVGLEDNIYIRKGELATNAQLVENAVKIIDSMGSKPATGAEARDILGLPPRCR